MKNENAKLVFIRALLGNVESCASVTHKIPSKVYFNWPFSDFDIADQKNALAELKKNRIISNFKLDDGDFIVSKPSQSMLQDYFIKLKDKPVKPEMLVDTKVRFDENTGIISMVGKTCPITLNTNHYFLCKTLFKEKFGTPVTETDILDMIDWAKDTKRGVYDAMNAVNKKIRNDLGLDKFFRWKTGRVWIDHEQK